MLQHQAPTASAKPVVAKFLASSTTPFPVAQQPLDTLMAPVVSTVSPPHSKATADGGLLDVPVLSSWKPPVHAPAKISSPLAATARSKSPPHAKTKLESHSTVSTFRVTVLEAANIPRRPGFVAKHDVYVKVMLMDATQPSPSVTYRTSTCRCGKSNDPSWRGVGDRHRDSGLGACFQQVKPSSFLLFEVWEEDVYCGGTDRIDIVCVFRWCIVPLTALKICLCVRCNVGQW
jgi:hypothetical protein